MCKADASCHAFSYNHLETNQNYKNCDLKNANFFKTYAGAVGVVSVPKVCTSDSTAPYQCVFRIGDGTSATSEVKISNTLTGDACAAACALKKKTDHSINGVTINQDGTGGCWCEKEMTGIKVKQSFTTCFLKVSYTCSRADGDSGGAGETKIGHQTGDDCHKECVEK